MRRPHAEAEWAAWEPTDHLAEDPQNRNEAYCQPVQPDCGRIVTLVALSTSVRLPRERPADWHWVTSFVLDCRRALPAEVYDRGASGIV
jgi:hypothetical protein